MESVSDITGEYILPENKFIPPSGKRFKGWSTEQNGEIITKIVVDETSSNVPDTVYAIWEDIPTINFEKYECNYGELSKSLSEFGITFTGKIPTKLTVNYYVNNELKYTENINMNNENATILNEKLNPGNYDVEISGIYDNDESYTVKGKLIINKVKDENTVQKKSNSPQTGDTIFFAIGVLTISLISIFIIKRK